MAIARTLAYHEHTVRADTASITVRLRIFDAIDANDTVAGIQEFRVLDVVVAPGSPLETALLNFESALLVRLNVLYPGKDITRPAP